MAAEKEKLPVSLLEQIERFKLNLPVYKKKMNHPFIYMSGLLALWCIYTSSSPPTMYVDNPSIRGSSNNDDRNFQLSPMVSVDGTMGNGQSQEQAGNIQQQDGKIPGSEITGEKIVITRNGKPIMYTFFERIDNNNRGTGMDDDADNALITAWKAKWEEAGWDPMVLSMKHAKRHPRYREFRDKLQLVPMKGNGGQGKNRLYNELCFYRWLAMAVVGGGWMSDYDVFPLGNGSGHPTEAQSPELPHFGTFSIYSVVPGSIGAGIPCLMSGADTEWERMAFTILQNGMEHQNEKHWTDMFSLMDLRFSTYLYNWSDEVVSAELVLPQYLFSEKDCDLTKDKRAVHFSHSAMTVGHWKRFANNGNVDENVNEANYRPTVVLNWFEMWNNVCILKNGNNGAEDQTPQEAENSNTVSEEVQV